VVSGIRYRREKGKKEKGKQEAISAMIIERSIQMLGVSAVEKKGRQAGMRR
jgi:hypothetical protein